MPRLKNKRHELFCYATVYRNATKSNALQFAGLTPKGNNYAISERADVKARIEELRKMDKAMVMRGEYGDMVEEAVRQYKVFNGQNISREWFLEELYTNVQLAREKGKIKEATEALKVMAQVFKVLAEVDQGEHQLDMRIQKLVGSDTNRAQAVEVSEEFEGSDGMGDASGDASEAEPEIEILGPGES
jgi:hypothetical protein